MHQYLLIIAKAAAIDQPVIFVNAVQVYDAVFPQRNSGAQNKSLPTTIKGTSEWNVQTICRCGFFSPL